MGLPAPNHWLDRESIDAGIGPSCAHTRLHRTCGSARRIRIRQFQYHIVRCNIDELRCNSQRQIENMGIRYDIIWCISSDDRSNVEVKR